MRCSRRRRRCFKHKLLYFKNTDASHPTPHHPSPTGAVSLRLGHTRGKTTLSCFLRPSCRFATSRGSLSYSTSTLIPYLSLLILKVSVKSHHLSENTTKKRSKMTVFFFGLVFQNVKTSYSSSTQPLVR